MAAHTMNMQARRLGFWVGLLAAVFFMTTVAEARKRRRRRSRSVDREGKVHRKKRRKAKRRSERRIKRRIRRRARRYFKKGKRHYRKERFKKAIRMFRRAYAILPHRNILLNIAICHAEMGEPVKAMVQLRAALMVAGKKANQLLDRREYRKLLDMQQRVAVLKITAPDPRAVIFLNGESLGAAEMDRVLYPGSYLVEVKLDNRIKLRLSLKLGGGARKNLKLKSWTSAAATASAQGGSVGAADRGRGRRLHVAYVAVAAGLTLVAGSAAIGTAVKYQHQKPDGESYRRASYVLAGITAVSAVSAVVLAIFTDWSIFKKEPANAKTTILPFTGPGSAGIVVTGRF